MHVTAIANHAAVAPWRVTPPCSMASCRPERHASSRAVTLMASTPAQNASSSGSLSVAPPRRRCSHRRLGTPLTPYAAAPAPSAVHVWVHSGVAAVGAARWGGRDGGERACCVRRGGSAPIAVAAASVAAAAVATAADAAVAVAAAADAAAAAAATATSEAPVASLTPRHPAPGGLPTGGDGGRGVWGVAAAAAGVATLPGMCPSFNQGDRVMAPLHRGDADVALPPLAPSPAPSHDHGHSPPTAYGDITGGDTLRIVAVVSGTPSTVRETASVSTARPNVSGRPSPAIASNGDGGIGRGGGGAARGGTAATSSSVPRRPPLLPPLPLPPRPPPAALAGMSSDRLSSLTTGQQAGSAAAVDVGHSAGSAVADARGTLGRDGGGGFGRPPPR